MIPRVRGASAGDGLAPRRQPPPSSAEDDRATAPTAEANPCKAVHSPPKNVTSWRTCPNCGSRATKLFHLNTGLHTCQICEHKYIWEPK
jgi:hypothetical protein